MEGRIYLIGDQGQLLSMAEQAYEAEDLLQVLLADHPDLLAGDQMRPTAPRRWILVSRELAVPDEGSESGRWSLDHLFIDQEGIPTLVEVKRSSNSQIRREVVGQMLDYAANGTMYWSLEQIQTAFERRCEREGLQSDEALGEFLGDEAGWDVASFWQAVKTNLQAGRVRLVFVADHIPPELRRIIEFLNDQMDPAEVMGVEVPQFVGSGRQALVPRVVGVTAEAERRKAVSSAKRRKWDEGSFFADLADRTSIDAVEAARQIVEWAKERGLQIVWGTGAQYGSFSPKAEAAGNTVHMFTVYTDHSIQFAFSAMSQPPFDALEKRRELAKRLLDIYPDLRLDDSKLERWPTSGTGVVQGADRVKAFLSVWDWYLDEIRSAMVAERDA